MNDKDYPEYVTFAEAADLLVRKGFVRSMTSHGLRYIALHAIGWPFGDGKGREPYRMAGRTRMMRTERLINFIREHPPQGRGPDKAPRRKRGNT